MIIISHVVPILHVFDRGALQGHEKVVDDPKVPLDGILHVARALVQIIGDGLDVRRYGEGSRKIYVVAINSEK